MRVKPSDLSWPEIYRLQVRVRIRVRVRVGGRVRLLAHLGLLRLGEGIVPGEG